MFTYPQLTQSEEAFLRNYAGVVHSQMSQLPQHNIDQGKLWHTLPHTQSTRIMPFLILSEFTFSVQVIHLGFQIIFVFKCIRFFGSSATQKACLTPTYELHPFITEVLLCPDKKQGEILPHAHSLGACTSSSQVASLTALMTTQLPTSFLTVLTQHAWLETSDSSSAGGAAVVTPSNLTVDLVGEECDSLHCKSKSELLLVIVNWFEMPEVYTRVRYWAFKVSWMGYSNLNH